MGMSSIERLGDAISLPEGTVELKGFVEHGVTYEDTAFFVHIGARFGGLKPDADIYCRNGGGWSRLSVRHRMTRAIRTLIEAGDDRAAFLLCYELFDQVRDASAHTWAVVKTAMAQGRLKKERQGGGTRARPVYSIFIENEDGSRYYGA